MHVEFVGQNLKRHSFMRWPFCLQRPRLGDDSLWRGPSAGIPRAECFDGDAKSYRALRLGQSEPRPNFPQSRASLAIGHDDAIGPRLVRSEWMAMKIRSSRPLRNGPETAKVFQLVGSDRSR